MKFQNGKTAKTYVSCCQKKEFFGFFFGLAQSLDDKHLERALYQKRKIMVLIKIMNKLSDVKKSFH